jgi:hypothetical protein
MLNFMVASFPRASKIHDQDTGEKILVNPYFAEPQIPRAVFPLHSIGTSVAAATDGKRWSTRAGALL